MITAAVRLLEFLRPRFGKPTHATLRKLEFVLSVTLAAQTIALALRYAV